MNRVLQRFPGGVRVPRFKELTNTEPVAAVPIPERLAFPLRGHIGTPARPVVQAGERVLKGQPIAQADSYVSQTIHASTSGSVIGIEEHPIAHPGGLPGPCILLAADGEDRAVDPWPALPAGIADPEIVQERIRQAGVIGMGGAGFPAHVKVREGIGRGVDMLIVNAVECEPYITCDDRLIRDAAGAVVAGARLLKTAVGARGCVIAIEEDMPEAAAALAPHVDGEVELVRVPAIYPAGGEKQLIKTITGREVPARGLPIEVGVLMHNLATAYAVYQAVVQGRPLTSRYVTVAGTVARPRNVEARLGTPVGRLIDCCGRPERPLQRLIMGGPMMGLALASEEVPVGKTTNCLLVASEPEAAATPMPCIRCGECVEACPVGLNPQALYELSRQQDLDGAQDEYLFDCIECGACAYVCPSRLPLVHYFRFAKSEVEALDVRARQIEERRARHAAHLARRGQGADERGPQDDDAARGGDTASAKPDKAAMQAEIRAAIERARAKRRHGRDSDEPE